MNKNIPDSILILLTNIARIHANIKFADTKAAGISILNTSLLGILFARFEQTSNLAINDITNIPAFAAMVMLVISIVMGVMVAWPRGNKYVKKYPGLVDPVRITEYKCDEFVAELSRSRYEIILRQTQELTWCLSKIDREKYNLLKNTFYASMLAWIISLVAVAISGITILNG